VAVSKNRPAHRPSRKSAIVDAAIRVIAEKGFVDASITDVAEEADVAVTAVYYHFSGKDELFDAAMSQVLGAITAAASAARPEDAPGDEAGLRAVINAVWDWVDENPTEAMLAYLHLPGATRQMAQLRREFDDHHVRRAFDYVNARGATPTGTNAARHAAATLALRTLVDTLMAVHQLRLMDGPINAESPAVLRRAVQDLSTRIILVT